MKHRISFALLLSAGLLSAQPVIETGGVRNSASLTFGGLPSGDIAQGSIFTVMVTSNVAVPNQLLGSYPIGISFNGASMKVTVGSTAVDVLMFGTAQRSAGEVQLDGILPSTTPLGSGTITVTLGGQTSAPAAINVVASSFAWYTATSEGVGPGAFTDLNYQYITPTHAANPGEYVVGWGTGLGAVSGDEAAGPVVAAINPPGLTMWVGGVQVTPIYTGRTPDAGEDQVNFQIPAGVTGCAVPVTVQIGNVVSNTATIAIAANGRVCSDSNGFSTADLQTLVDKGTFTIGSVTLDRYINPLVPGQIGVPGVGDNGTALFARLQIGSIAMTSGPFTRPSIGTCTVFNNAAVLNFLAGATGLDAGPTINVTGPAGLKQLTDSTAVKGDYTGQFGTGFLVPGSFTIDNGPGGTDIGQFKVSVNMPSALTWTNQDSILNIDRSKGVTVTWSGGDPNSYALISGSSTVFTNTLSASFMCAAPIADGTFTVPASVLLALPPSSGPSPMPSYLLVGSATTPVRFNAPGMNVGYASTSTQSSKNVIYQ